MDLKIVAKRVDKKIAVLNLEGDMDVFTSPRLKDAIITSLKQGSIYLLINMKKVNYMDSTGLGVLVGSLRRVREHKGKISLIAPHSRVQRILDITDLTAIFKIYKDEKEGIRKIKKDKEE
jgi:anti-sigma B factor antagonist